MAATGKTVPDIAADYGYSKMTLYRVISGKSMNTELRAIISELTQTPVDVLWPVEEESR